MVPKQPARPWAEGGTLGLALVLGWNLTDAAVFLGRGAGTGALPFLGWALPGLALFALAGAAFARWPGTLVVALALGLAASFLPARFPAVFGTYAHASLWLPRMFTALVLAWIAARLVVRFLSERSERAPRPLEAGVVLGALAAAGLAMARLGLQPESLLVASVAAAWAAALWLPLAPTARASVAIVLLVPAGSIVWRSGHRPAALLVGPPSAVAAADAHRPDLVLIVLDTVRADHLGCYGHERDTTPRLDAFAAERAVRYTQARSSSPFTLASHASLFTGLPTARHNAARPGPAARPMRTDVPTLPERLHRAGYATAAIVANHVYLNELYGFDRGFDHFDARPGGNVGEYLALVQTYGASLRPGHLYYREAAEITDAAVDWLEERPDERPFFLFLNYLDTHYPYRPPPPWDRAFGDAQPLDPMHPPLELWPLLYDRELAYVDAQVGRLLEWLEREGTLDDAVVIVTADHGEALGEKGIPWHNWHLFDALVHVPLLVKPAGPRERELDERSVSSYDVTAITLEELGLEPGPRAEPGAATAEWYPNLPPNADQVRWGERTGFDPAARRVSWVEGGRKLIVGSGGTVLAFDLERDPGEEHPLELDEAAREEALARARAWWEENPLEDSEAPELSPERRAAMRALGYGG